MSVNSAITDLHAEIIEILETHNQASSGAVLAVLNGPARVQGRGFYVKPEHLLAIIASMHRIDEDSRFVIEAPSGELLNRIIYDRLEEAQEDANQLDDTVIRRFQT